MSSPVPNPSNPDATPGASRPWTRWLRRVHLGCRAAWLIGALLLATLLGAWVIGLPARFTNRLLHRLPTRPLLVTADRMSLDPRAGLLLHRVLIYPDDSFDEPLARIGELALRPSWKSLLAGKIRLASLAIRDADVFAPAWKDSAPDARLMLTNVSVDIRLGDGTATVRRAQARFADLHLSASGRLRDLHRMAGARDALLPPQFLGRLRDPPRALIELVDVLHGLRGPTGIPVAISFDLGPTGQWARAECAAGPLTVRGRRVQEFRADGAWRDGDWFLDELALGDADGRAVFSGSLTDSMRRVELAADGEVPAEAVEAFLPRAWRGYLDRGGWQPRGRVRLSGKIGPAAPDALLAHLNGELAFERLSVRGVVLSDGQVRLAGAPGALMAEPFSVRVGEGGKRGRAKGRLTWAPAERRLDIELDARLDPNELIPLFTSNQTRFVRRFSFPGALPQFRGLARAHPGAGDLSFSGRLTAAEFTYRGVEVATLSSTVLFSNQTVTLDPWTFTRPEGVTRGRLSADLRRELVKVDLESTMNPLAVAGLVGPRLHQALSAWRFEGPAWMHARGTVDLKAGNARTDLVLDTRGERMGRGRWMADNAQFTLRATGETYSVTNLAGRAYDGDFTGTVRVEPAAAGPEHRYAVDAVLTNADFAKIAGRYARAADTPIGGRAFLTLHVTGLVADAFGPATRGGGALAIEDGALFRLPLLGGLSDLLSRIMPGLGFVSQTDLTCTYAIEDGSIATEDLRLAGDLLSMKSRGDLEFDGHLHFRVEVQLLRRGPLAFLLRLITFPVTKLFEFQLSGTLDEPRWRPVNLPKELFLIFD